MYPFAEGYNLTANASRQKAGGQRPTAEFRIMAEPKTPQELIARIEAACEGRRCLFRGTEREFHEVSSGIYRKYKDEGLFVSDHFRPVDIEKEIVESARVHFTSATTNVEVLTDLRHFGADTTVIDFSRNLFVALFFACNGECIAKDGHMIVLEVSDDRAAIKDINYEDRSLENATLEPARTSLSRARVEFQSSVFVHAPMGIVPKKHYKSISVPKHLKQKCLEYLRKFHNIHEETIYNDLIGFIANQKNFETASLGFFKGLAHSDRGQQEEAVTDYGKATKLRPDDAYAWNNRGVALAKLDRHEEAIANFDRAIILQPDFAHAWKNRGNARASLDRHEQALADFDRAIKLRPDDAYAWNNRGNELAKLGRHEEAIADFDRAIILQPDFAQVKS